MGRDGGIATVEPAEHVARAGRHVLHLDALGLSFTVRSNDPGILIAVDLLCRNWRAGDADPSGRRLDIDIEICSLLDNAGPLQVIAEPSNLRLEGPGLRGWADASTGRATCIVSRGWADSGQLPEEAIEPLMLFLLSHADRTPIHASACVIDGMAIVLAGPSGTGKSCLAYAARAAGLAILSDDTVHIQLHPELRVWGIPRPIHVYPADAPREAGGALRWRNGKLKRAIEQEGDRAVSARHAVLCLLHRGDAVGLGIVRPAQGTPALPPLEPGFDLLATQSHAAYSAISARGFARLTLGSDPAEAINELCRHKAELARIAAG